jgi:hypothetical protein
MRTTLNISDDVYDRVKQFAAARSISTGEATSVLLNRALSAGPPTRWENGLLIFDPGSGVEDVTLEHTLQLEDAMEDELA